MRLADTPNLILGNRECSKTANTYITSFRNSIRLNPKKIQICTVVKCSSMRAKDGVKFALIVADILRYVVGVKHSKRHGT